MKRRWFAVDAERLGANERYSKHTLAKFHRIMRRRQPMTSEVSERPDLGGRNRGRSEYTRGWHSRTLRSTTHGSQTRTPLQWLLRTISSVALDILVRSSPTKSSSSLLPPTAEKASRPSRSAWSAPCLIRHTRPPSRSHCSNDRLRSRASLSKEAGSSDGER